MYNPRERTRAAIEALERQAPDEAIAAAQTASNIDSTDETGRFNLGTVRLLAGDAEGAVEPLTAAANADSALAVDAAYNLGSAHHQRQDLEQAIDWYEETLRRDPSRMDAKINLELALQKQQQEEKRQQDQQAREDEPQRDPSQERAQEQESESEPGDEPSPDEARPQDSSGSQQPQPEPQPGDEPSRLPQFEPRRDMTAEEAASLLEAVEAMEREARAEMQPEARRAAPGDRDW